MAVATGKRKREATRDDSRKIVRAVSPKSDSEDDDARLKAIFQKHFEAQYKPLRLEKIEKTEIEVIEDLEDEEDDEDGWEGFSSEDEHAPVQVVEYSVSQTNAEDDDDPEMSAKLSKKELKAFLSGKVPLSSASKSTSSATRKAKTEDQDDNDKLNLKNDLALQRLLSESHLLTPSSSLEASGKNRLRALDIRMQSLGAKSSTFDGGKMPMNMRKGITSHRQGLEEKRRRDAKENGVILEREKREKTVVRRERGVEGHSVGKYKGGMLTLSKRDVRAIEGPKERGRGGKRGRGGRR